MVGDVPLSSPLQILAEFSFIQFEFSFFCDGDEKPVTAPLTPSRAWQAVQIAHVHRRPRSHKKSRTLAGWRKPTKLSNPGRARVGLNGWQLVLVSISGHLRLLSCSASWMACLANPRHAPTGQRRRRRWCQWQVDCLLKMKAVGDDLNQALVICGERLLCLLFIPRFVMPNSCRWQQSGARRGLVVVARTATPFSEMA